MFYEISMHSESLFLEENTELDSWERPIIIFSGAEERVTSFYVFLLT